MKPHTMVRAMRRRGTKESHIKEPVVGTILGCQLGSRARVVNGEGAVG